MIKDFIKYYKPYKKTLTAVILGSLLIAVLDLVFPMAVRHILQQILPLGDYKLLASYGSALGLLYVLNYFMMFAVSFYGHTLSAKIENNMRIDLFRHLQAMSFRYFDNNRTGQLLSRITGDIAEIGELAFRGPNDLLVCTITMTGTVAIMFWMNIKLGFLVALLLIAKTIHTIYVNNKMKMAFRANRSKNGELAAQTEEGLSGVRLVKAFARESQQLGKFSIKSGELLQTKKQSYKILAHFGGSVNFFTNFANLAVLLGGGFLIIQQELQMSDFVAFLLYVNLFMKPMFRLTFFTEIYQRGMAGFYRFLEIMNVKPEITDDEDAVKDWPIRGEVEFKDVVFGYSADKTVLTGLNFRIEPGETVAFVGETGVGKTTIANMLLRFYEPAGGKITIDGVDIKKIRQRYLRESIGLVQQDVFLFSDTIYNNIAFGRPEASEEEIKEAARLAAASNFIEAMPDKYQTEIGERGVKLSGGQKQRLALARIFLKKPPILILDEATSSLDNKTEKDIQSALDELVKDRTTIIIAHRLSTVISSDRIVVIDKNGVAEAGTHQQLLAKRGIYFGLYQLQSTLPQGNDLL
ncbi:MAG: ABC transporter ATP-binding protein [Acidaminococcaceae bacterium]|nr:ABC transporter ATP-binding protein [Acidaminococcaceae bacterium]